MLVSVLVCWLVYVGLVETVSLVGLVGLCWFLCWFVGWFMLVWLKPLVWLVWLVYVGFCVGLLVGLCWFG